jgi:hypothetical protein
VTTSTPTDQSLQAFNQTSLIRKYESDIESLKKWILFILLNKGFLFALFMVLLFILYVIIKRYVKKKINKSIDIENLNLNSNNETNDILKEFLEFQKIVSSLLNFNTA